MDTYWYISRFHKKNKWPKWQRSLTLLTLACRTNRASKQKQCYLLSMECTFTSKVIIMIRSEIELDQVSFPFLIYYKFGEDLIKTECAIAVKRYRLSLFEPRHEKTNIWHMRKQRRRSAPLFWLHG